MIQHYNQNYKREHICFILDTIKDCVRENRYTISKNEKRQENIGFIQEYNLTGRKQKEILLKIEVEDFCHTLQNTNLGFEHETLYVFCPSVILFNIDDVEELVDIYTKSNIVDVATSKRVVVISFHKRNKPIDYLLR